MLQKKQEAGGNEPVYTESDFVTEASSGSLQDQAAADAWFQTVKAKTEELFYRQI